MGRSLFHRNAFFSEKKTFLHFRAFGSTGKLGQIKITYYQLRKTSFFGLIMLYLSKKV